MRVIWRLALVVMLFVAFVPVPPLLSQARVGTIYEENLEGLKEKLKKQGFTSEELEGIFTDSRFELYPEIIGKKGKGINYFSRRFGLLTKRSVVRGKGVLARHREVFKNAEEQYGVDRETIAAILRVETNFGSTTGTYPVLNSLTTLAVVENRRTKWAQDEVAQLLKMCREKRLDPFSIRGSWAGAFGISQFVPSSYVKFAVDGNGDGVVDLFTMGDAVASIANYLKEHGWEKDKRAQKWQAVYAYNHCDNYVKAVFAYARALKK